MKSKLRASYHCAAMLVACVERKFDYVRKPELKGQDPGSFTVLALPLPAE
jgi:hypothetical protein